MTLDEMNTMIEAMHQELLAKPAGELRRNDDTYALYRRLENFTNTAHYSFDPDSH